MRRADRPGVEAVFISCINVPTCDVSAPLERDLGKLVVTANQVTLWAALRRMELEVCGPGQRLLGLPTRL